MDYAAVKNRAFPEVSQELSERDTIIYALGVGFGYDPLDEFELKYVYEHELHAVPSMASVLCHPGFWLREPDTGIDWVHSLHVGQSVVLHSPLPVTGCVTARNEVASIVDKGAGTGALLQQRRQIVDADSGAALATVEQTLLLRGDGGLTDSDEPTSPPSPMPERQPDAVCDLPTMPQAALLYRLSADPNPLHVLPEVARKAGFDRPILHGLCTFGVATHALLRTVCNESRSRLNQISVRFSAPVFPGETVRTEIWRTENNTIAFRSSIPDRGVTVLARGSAELG